jgi:hypothetical protein
MGGVATAPYEAACAAIDRANAEDPRGYEILYGRRMVEWAEKLAPGASEELLLAVRAQHVRRWTVPRSTFPEGRVGYLQWRERLKKFHAETLGAIMKDAGYAESSIAKARQLILRKNAAADPEGQVLEDAACLVFLQHEFSDFARKTPPDKVVDILRKTWEKMSARGRDRALGLPYGPDEQALLRRALAPPP